MTQKLRNFFQHVHRRWYHTHCVICLRVGQGHHHNGDRAARRPHILCSICFGALAKAVQWLFKASLHNEQSKAILKCTLLTFWSTSITGWLKFEMGTFLAPVWSARGGGGRSGTGPFDSSPNGFLLPPHGLSLTVFSYLAGSKRVSARPTRIRWQKPL